MMDLDVNSLYPTMIASVGSGKSVFSGPVVTKIREFEGIRYYTILYVTANVDDWLGKQNCALYRKVNSNNFFIGEVEMQESLYLLFLLSCQ